MIRAAAILCLSSSAVLAAPQHPDLLRFTNGDQLHGSFVGIKDGPQAVWRRDDLAAPVEFKTERIRHIVLHGGHPTRPLESLAYVGLVNGDRVPSVVTGIEAEWITLDSACAGLLKIPRRQVSILAPNPLGGRVYYHGPFAKDDWKMTHAAFPDGIPDTAGGEADQNGDEHETPQPWTFSGSAWYWQNKTPGTAIVREFGMPDRAVLHFDLAWKNRLSLAIAFHADFTRPNPKDAENEKARDKIRAFVPGDASDLPRLFGNSYVLQLVSNYLMMFRTSVNEAGEPMLKPIQLNNNNLRLGDSGKATVEIRSNRLTGAISLFVNDEFVAQWSESDSLGGDGVGFAGKGAGFGFVVQGNDAPVRISDIIVSEWNGMPDSARSLQSDDQDVVLMANGTDRYAGKVGGLDAEGRVLFEGKHGSFRFPIEEVAEIRFASKHLAPSGETPSNNVVVSLNPIGSISGQPLSGDATTLGLLSPVLGEISVSLDSAVLLDFNASNQFTDNWDADF